MYLWLTILRHKKCKCCHDTISIGRDMTASMKEQRRLLHKLTPTDRGELSYLAPLGSENISAPYFKQYFFRGGDYPQTVKHHASQSQDRNNKYFILYIKFCINNNI